MNCEPNAGLVTFVFLFSLLYYRCRRVRGDSRTRTRAAETKDNSPAL